MDTSAKVHSELELSSSTKVPQQAPHPVQPGNKAANDTPVSTNESRNELLS